MKRARYEVRPDGDRFIVWDTELKKTAISGWRFGQEQYAKDAAAGLNREWWKSGTRA